MNEITLIEAVNHALDDAMKEDDNVVIFGEDVGVNGGVFRATDRLAKRYGNRRVVDTPLAESMICGMAVGMAAQGLRPVAEIQFMGFIYPAVDQIISHAARLRNRTRGRLSCPMVVRAPFGGGIKAPEHHSESMEALFAHMPGLRVVIPSSPARAYGLLLAAIRDPDPVIFLEPKRLYRLAKENVALTSESLPLDVCFVLRPGSDITLISWGAMLHETLLAADTLQQDGISVEVIDVATIKPLDITTIMQSVEKTGRCVIVHEAPLSGGWGAEIAAQVAELGLMHLLAPIKRITGFDTIVPLYRIEASYMPSVERILSGIRDTLEFG